MSDRTFDLKNVLCTQLLIINENHVGVPSHELSSENREVVKESLFTAYNIHLKDKISQELQAVGSNHVSGEGEPKKMTSEWTITWWQQFTVLLERGLKERRHESFSGLKVAEVVFVALIAGALWWKSNRRVPEQIGSLYFLGQFWSLYPTFQALFTFPQERRMLTKERSSRMYRLSSYFMARMVGDLPMELILPIVFILIFYWMIGLKSTAANFFMTLATTLFNVLVAQGIGLLLGAVIMDLKSATTLASVIMLTFMLAGGFFVQKVPKFIAWIKYISLNFHSFKLLALSQYDPDETYPCGPNGSCRVADIPTIEVVGIDRAYLSVVVMFAMFFICRLISYLALMRVGVSK